MNLLNTLAFLLLATIFTFLQTDLYAKTPHAVQYVDAKNFSGLWYEIARTYNRFEKDCVAASIEYKLIEPLKYEVTNRCFEKEIGAKLIVYNGIAESTNNNSMSELEKTYFWVFSQEYMIMYLDDYNTAVMCDVEMEHVWIMHRKPFLQKQKLQAIISILNNYMDTKRLIYTPQDKNGRYK